MRNLNVSIIGIIRLQIHHIRKTRRADEEEACTAKLQEGLM